MKFLICALLFVACSTVDIERPAKDKVYFDFEMEENSGMAYSPTKKLFYIIQDHGNPAEILVATIKGEFVKRIKLPVNNNDFEGIAYEAGKIYVGDIGDNEDNGTYRFIHIFDEETYRRVRTIKYNNNSTNAEGLAVKDGVIYLTTKNYDSDNHILYKLNDNILEKVFNFKSSSVGALSISNNGKFIVIEDDESNIRFFDKTGRQTKVISDLPEGSKESLEVIGPNELIYSAEGLNYFRRVKW